LKFKNSFFKFSDKIFIISLWTGCIFTEKEIAFSGKKHVSLVVLIKKYTSSSNLDLEKQSAYRKALSVVSFQKKNSYGFVRLMRPTFKLLSQSTMYKFKII